MMHTELTSLWLPIALSAVALFFASFLSWMVLQLHAKDWVKIENEDSIIDAVREAQLKPGNYMFPGCGTAQERNSPDFKAKMKAGPRGVLTVFADIGMGRNLAFTFVYFLVVNYCLAYLATLVFNPGTEFYLIFRFMTTAAFMVFLSAIVAHSIWFRCRIVGHIIESILYALIVGVIFAWKWPGVLN